MLMHGCMSLENAITDYRDNLLSQIRHQSARATASLARDLDVLLTQYVVMHCPPGLPTALAREAAWASA